MATVRLQSRRDTLANWTAENPILGSGEHGFETDTGYERIGDGSTAFLSLPRSFSGYNNQGALLHGTLVAGSAGAGDIVVNGGIFLGGSAAANELNDYEEGTWTPVLSDGVNADATYSIQVGSFIKVGNTVRIQGRIALTDLGSLSGSMRITGLPFVSSAVANNFGAGIIGFASGLNITAGHSMNAYINPNTTYMLLTLWDGAAGTSEITHTEMSANGGVIFSAEYIAS